MCLTMFDVRSKLQKLYTSYAAVVANDSAISDSATYTISQLLYPEYVISLVVRMCARHSVHMCCPSFPTVSKGAGIPEEEQNTEQLMTTSGCFHQLKKNRKDGSELDTKIHSN